MDLHGELEWRGLVSQGTEGVREVLLRESVTGYIGFDPTASSLHIGSLLPILALVRLRGFGHKAIALVGGGTGLIGDPSGKTAERRLLNDEQVRRHVKGIQAQLTKIIRAGSRQMRALQPLVSTRSGEVRPVNNAIWLKRLKAIDFMRDVGKHFGIGPMLAKESIKRRLESQEGISYTEFSYLLLQAYDFLELSQRYKCNLQMGGSDQWGNITAGIELIRRVENKKVHGLVLPLVTTSSGAKFGKTEAGTIWLDETRTKPYEFHQFWLNVDDSDAGKYLRFFTFLDRARIDQLEDLSAAEPTKRHAQRELARQVTELVHGGKAAHEAEAAAARLFRSDVSELPAAELLELFRSAPSLDLPNQEDGWKVAWLVTQAKFAVSMSQAGQLIKSGAISVNNRRITDVHARVRPADAIERKLFILQKGKRDKFLFRIAAS